MIEELEEISIADGNRLIKIVSEGYIAEVYTTSIGCREQRGWKRHLRTTCRLSVVAGSVNIYLQQLSGAKEAYSLTETKPQLLVIQPMVWYMFEGVAKKSIIINTPNLRHDPTEMENRDLV